MRLYFANGLFWVSVACCVIAQLYIVQSVRGNRHVAEPASGLPRSRDAVEMMWAILPALSLGVLLFFTWRAVRGTAAMPLAQPQGVVGRP